MWLPKMAQLPLAIDFSTGYDLPSTDMVFGHRGKEWIRIPSVSRRSF
jgi:hypothetical protein